MTLQSKMSLDPTWLIEQEGFDPSRERELEPIYALGNGYLGIRGACDIPLPSSQGDLFIAGVYSKKIATRPYSEIQFMTASDRDNPHAELAPLPFPYGFAINTKEGPLHLASPSLKRYNRVLDLKQALVFTAASFECDGGGKVILQSLRCASRADPHLLLQEIEIRCDAEITIDLSMRAADLDINYPHLENDTIKASGSPAELFGFKTLASSYEIGLASRVFQDDEEVGSCEVRAQAKPRKAFRIRKLISVFTSRDGNNPIERTRTHLLSKRIGDFESYIADHVKAWGRLWRKTDLLFPGHPALTQAERFNIYQLLLAANHDPKISIGARTLTGRAYEGHVFWDAETFMFPFFLYTEPDIAKNMLLYRHRTLPAAKDKAAKLGCRGACYAWESTVTGEDVTPKQILIQGTNVTVPILTGTQQIHVTADIAHAVWLYWDATMDNDFMWRFGAEILVETARFWATRAVKNGQHLHITSVIGPDEYHFNVTDNAFTNWMAKLNLQNARAICERMAKEQPEYFKGFCSKLAIEPGEFEQWQNSAKALFIPIPNTHGVIEQFQGFFDLKDVSIDRNQRLKPPVERLLEWDEINRQKIIKQADVLMIPFLFPSALTRKIMRANYLFYEPLTDHASSLSPPVHAAIAARVGLEEEAEKYWKLSINLDLENLMSNTALGVHGGCMGAAWQALVFHFLGVEFKNGMMAINASHDPSLPSFCRKTRLKLYYRQKEFSI